ncbi:MAG: dTDP-4-dehydrorhamnose reductase [Bacteroidales bacterium]|nr:dTDP-4-dehydrorhamnose reductase [Bacteroidales bacterium]
MNILVTGAYGQLGRSLRRILENDPEVSAVFTDADTLDITDKNAVEKAFADSSFDIIINCAAYTDVNKAESDEVMAACLNTQAVGNLAAAAARHGARLIHVSTDYVFAGDNSRPYVENDEPYPHSIYGRTKLEGEGLLMSLCPEAVIIRTAWLYSEFGRNFVKTMLSVGAERGKVAVVSDQIGTPTYAGDLAEAIVTVIRADKWVSGIYHFTDEGVASWYDFAKAIFELSGMNSVEVAPIDSVDYPTPARRPQYSVLSKNKIKNTFGLNIPYWRDSLKVCLARMNNE